MEKLIIASNNKGKIVEIKAILAPYFREIVSMKEAGIIADPEETGATFYENALIKAKAIYEIAKTPVLSDDSGICADALDGAPGVYSAGYSGARDDNANNEKLLSRLKSIGAVTKEQRAAHFTCCAVLYISPERVIIGEGKTHGHILDKVTGGNGFGYDVIFFSDDLNAPFGLAEAEAKNKVSHRARALQQIVDKLYFSF